LSGAGAALPIWTDFMRAAATVEDPGDFTVPPVMVVRRPCGSPTEEMFLPLTAPDEACGPAAPPVARSYWPLAQAGPSDR
jgi:membrane carboxypeptidase/penicillin-binding protein